MKKNQINVGSIYLAKIGNNTASVRIDGQHVRGGWNATNMDTGKKVHIKSAQTLREPAELPAGAENTATVAAAPAEPTTATEPASVAAQSAAKRPRRAKDGDGEIRADRPLGIVSAAIRVLEDHQNQTAMNCSEMVAEMQEKGYWQPRKGGKTPANTLYSAILREINIKDQASRFRKSERGKFLLNTGA